MKTCPNCGAPQADSLPACSLCGYLFPVVQSPVKRRFEKRIFIALGADLVTIIGATFFFNFIWMQNTPRYDSATMALHNILLLIMILITAAGPILGLIFSIVGLRKTRSTGTKGKPLAIAGIIISAILIPLTYFFVAMFGLAINS